VTELVAIGLGSNLPDRLSNLRWAVDKLARAPGTRLVRASSAHETAPVEAPGHGAYLNAVCTITTELDPLSLLRFANKLESMRGRSHGTRSGPRALDIDILLWGDRVIESKRLTIPHRRMHMRAFVLAPLCEVAPEIIHPIMGIAAAELERSVPSGHPAVRRLDRKLVVS
jgi:2-amino-4-hydroxy-6-hydroxymethyldihydropteridine diphosphokinase